MKKKKIWKARSVATLSIQFFKSKGNFKMLVTHNDPDITGWSEGGFFDPQIFGLKLAEMCLGLPTGQKDSDFSFFSPFLKELGYWFLRHLDRLTQERDAALKLKPE